jgi:hypothetical protein
MREIGIALDSNYDLKIVVTRDANGMITRGLQLEEALPQNQAVLLLARIGELKENPAMGVGLGDMINDNDTLGWERLIRTQLQLDRQVVQTVKFDNGKLKIDAHYAG